MIETFTFRKYSIHDLQQFLSGKCLPNFRIDLTIKTIRITNSLK